MPSQIALIITLAFISFLIYIEHKKTENISGVVWIIAIWILYSQSKGLGFFLNINTTIEAGSLPDRYFLIALGILSLIIILQRHFSFTDLLKGNIPIVAILIYSLISVIWSRFPLISFRGWGREAVAFILALLLCSEKYPTRTLVSAFKKAIYTALPLSILLIKYYPAYGRIYGRWSGELSWVGIASQKNGLAEICALSALFLIWSLEKNIKNLERSSSILSILTDIFMVSLALYLMMGPKKTFSYSATSFLALLVGLFFYMLLKVAAKYKINIERFIMTFVIIILTMGVVIPFSGKIPIQSLPKYLNRSETLTGRTEIWNSLIPYAKQQIILGHGFGGFWTTSLRDQIASHSHNGYLNTILELGLIGLLLFYLFFIIVIKKSFILLKSENQISFLFISIILMILVRNISEVSIGNISNYSMWLLVVWSIIIGKRSNLMKAEESPKDLHLTVISDKY